MDEEKNLNLNGEFLGVTSLAVYSAPWYLQVPLLVLVGLIFAVKVAQGSRRFRERMALAEEGQGEYDEVVEEVSRIFFGFSVARSDLPVYWIGALLFAITFVYSGAQLVLRLL